ncbi:hypothetical protein BBBOND_0404270 [Babesia bigemina]|uniref:Uncharacterized protein n=1 Tax=Babesia bigemina TaxID=5866 RepID=A0A061DE34_BABBI|nr:hypothetical protein BBBOND_0404270 [Babesia bigemina]CDR97939.1 hypothetical protein BBBOND_0404270 [Babesia bigemina]|eukprot:XP_012770125.1 hypothetical protein BBBOND_0404270 [Babesia bigemina]
MLRFNECKAEDRVLPKPTEAPEYNADYTTTMMSGGLLASLILKVPSAFFLTGAVFISRCFAADAPIEWSKAIVPLSGMMPSLFRLTTDVVQCLWNGTPL